MPDFTQTLKDRWFVFWECKTPEKDFSIKFALQVIVVLMMVFVIKTVLFRLTTLTHDAYFKPLLFSGLLKAIFSTFSIWVPLLALAGLANQRLLIPWSEFDEPRHTRNIVCFIVAMLTWRHAFYSYNFFLDQSHLFDRALLLVLVPLVYWRPFFVLPFLASVLLVIGQFELIEGYSLADSLLPLYWLILFVALYFFKIATRQFCFHQFAFLIGCVAATQYFFSGVGKLNWEWILYDRICLNIPYAYSIGWLSGLSPESSKWLVHAMDWVNIPIKILTLGIELGILFFFWDLMWARCLLLATLLFHVGIFLMTGICFWFWMVFHVFMLWYLWRSDVIDVQRLFNRKKLAFSMLIIICGQVWCQPVVLAWLDLPFFYNYQVVAQTSEERDVVLSPDFFGPYDYNFTFQAYHFLKPENKRIQRFRVKNVRETFRFFQEEHSDQEIFDYEARVGASFDSPQRADKFKDFLLVYIKNYNTRKASPKQADWWPVWVKPPDLLWQTQGVDALNPDEQVEKISIRCKTSYFSFRAGYRVIRDEQIDDFPISNNR